MRENGTIVGVGGAQRQRSRAWNLNYRIATAHQRHGFATQLGRAAYSAASALDASVPFIAWIDEHNLPSRKVAERLGLISYGPATDPSDGQVRIAYADPSDRRVHWMTQPAVVLRPVQPGDLALLEGGGESPFNDFGPRAERTSAPPADLDDRGGLTVLDDEGSVAGYVSWHYVQWGPNSASRCPMIGIGLLSTVRGRGIGRAAQQALAELFFTHTAVNRVEARTDVDNIAEQRALEAAGFTREGLVRGAQWRDGAYRDGYLYAIVRGDIPNTASRD